MPCQLLQQGSLPSSSSSSLSTCPKRIGSNIPAKPGSLNVFSWARQASVFHANQPWVALQVVPKQTQRRRNWISYLPHISCLNGIVLKSRRLLLVGQLCLRENKKIEIIELVEGNKHVYRMSLWERPPWADPPLLARTSTSATSAAFQAI